MIGRATIDGVQSPDEGRYSIEYAVCREMGWSYDDLMDAPADFVDEIVIRLSAENKARRTQHAREEQRRNQSAGKKR